MEYSSLKKRKVSELQRQQAELKGKLLGKTKIKISYDNNDINLKKYEQKLQKEYLNKKMIKNNQLKLNQKQLKKYPSKVSLKSFY